MSDSDQQTHDGVDSASNGSISSESGDNARFNGFGFVLAFVILTGWHFFHGATGPHWYRPPLSHGDGPDYESIAYSLSRGEGFQFAWQSESWQKPYRNDPESASYSQLNRVDWGGATTSRPPLYPALIALVYQFVPRGPLAFAAVRSVSILCTSFAGTLAVLLAFDVALRIFSNRWLAIVAAISTLSLALLDRTVRNYSIDFLTEPLSLLLCTVLLWSGLQWQAGYRRHTWFVVVVLSLAALILTRSMMVFWLPGLALLVGTTAERLRVRWGLLFLMSVSVCLLPWWIRNCVVLERIMPLGGQGAASLSGGYCDESLADRGNWHGRVEGELQREIDLIPGAEAWTQARREMVLADLATERTKLWLAAHNREVPTLVAMRVATHWGPFYGTSLMWRLGIVAGWLSLLSMRCREGIWILGLPTISTVTVAILYETGGRFLVPLYGILYMTAGLGTAYVARLLFLDAFRLCRKIRS